MSGPGTLRRRLTLALLVVALGSILGVGILNFFAAREILGSGAEERLSGIGRARARTIEQGTAQLQGGVSVVAADLTLTAALEDFVAGYDQLSDDLTAGQEAALRDWYRTDVIDPLQAAGLGPVTVDELLPASPEGRYLQYHYIVAPEPAVATGSEITDPGDGSSYSSAHARHHPYLAELAAGFTGGDLMLISAEGDVVYSVDKSIDLGTNLETGPYRDSTLAGALRDQLVRVAVGEAVVADWQLYLPNRGRPTLFLAAAVRRGTAVIGAVVVEVPAAALDAITTGNRQWSAVGLPTGESYVVGADLVLRSESRLWVEDPEAYLDRVGDDELVGLIETFRSPVGLQPVETVPVRTALDGEVFEGQATNYLGQATYSSAVPIGIPGVDWVVVVDTPLSEARDGLDAYLTRLGIVLFVMVPLVVVIGYTLAGRLARPIPLVVSAARAVAEGERNPELGPLGNDELGDLGRRLLRTASELGRQERALEAEFERKRRLLLSVLPSRLVNAEGEIGGGTWDAIEVTTAVAVGFEATDTAASPFDDDPMIEVLATVADLVDERAEERGVERIRLAADRHLFLAGAGRSDDDGAADALAFAVEINAEAKRLAAEEDVALKVHIGLSTGPVASGILDRGRLTFGAWGEPVRRALVIAALSREDEILIDQPTAGVIDPERFGLVPASDLVSLDGAPMQLFTFQGDSS